MNSQEKSPKTNLATAGSTVHSGCLGLLFVDRFGYDVEPWKRSCLPLDQSNMGVSENVVYPIFPMVLLIIIPFLNGYFIGNTIQGIYI